MATRPAPPHDDWRFTSKGDPRGYIQPEVLRELWFHTGTACNLSCPFCLEGSRPGDNRLNLIRFQDAKPLIDEALDLDVQQFSFTGGEPFVCKDIISILDYALRHRPCLVLTNGTDPLLRRFEDIQPLAQAPHPLSFRVSLDYPDAARHDQGRGEGSFQQSIQGMKAILETGFPLSVARQMEKGEDRQGVEERFARILQAHGLPGDLRLVAFPDFYSPGAHPEGIPDITEDCMTRYQDAESRSRFMCAFSKMAVKQDGKMRIYACTLVDDDPDYDQGSTLRRAVQQRVMLKHHRCFSCFSHGASCSEI
ncbi:MAG TPA: radical SAM protein [Acidobacteriota bacterium]|nr:radical SAM protein [Acidobacteriota bacterium]